MKKELKQAIINFIFDNDKEFQLTNAVISKFKKYIFSSDGNYLIGGKDVQEFIQQAIKLLINL